jgi:hypothetical protein
MRRACGASSTPRPIGTSTDVSGILDRPVKPGDDVQKDISLYSRRAITPELCRNNVPQQTEGAGKAGCPLHPQPRAQSVGSTRVSHHRYPGTPGLPCAMVLTVSFALSSATGLFCHRRLQVTTCKLDASVGASGPHDFAVRLGVTRQRHRRVHRIPLPTFVTIAKRPSW